MRSLVDIARGSLTTEAELAKMEIHLGLPDGFILGLLKDGDDWTFLLRLHALVEASLDYLIVAKLDLPVLHDWVIRHSIAGRTGKLRLAKLIGAIDGRMETVIDGLSDLRNQFAHGIQRIGVTLSEHIEKVTPGERSKILRWVLRSHGHEPSAEFEAVALDAWKMADRVVLWIACERLIQAAYEVRRTARGQQIEEAFGLRTEGGDLLTTESGDVLITENAPDLDSRSG